MPLAARFAVVLLACLAPLVAGAERPPLADRVAAAAGADAFGRLASLAFTFQVVAKKAAPRSHAWDLVAGRVRVTVLDETHEVPAAGLVDAADAARKRAHGAFINDSYWLLFCLHLRWDEAAITDLGRVPVPQLPDLGERPALAVQYPAQGGYTPGDRYVLYLGEDALPLAWAFHQAGSEAPTLVVRWHDWQDLHGLKVPTRFTTPDGKDFIRFRDVAATLR